MKTRPPHSPLFTLFAKRSFAKDSSQRALRRFTESRFSPGHTVKNVNPTLGNAVWAALTACYSANPVGPSWCCNLCGFLRDEHPPEKLSGCHLAKTAPANWAEFLWQGPFSRAIFEKGRILLPAGPRLPPPGVKPRKNIVRASASTDRIRPPDAKSSLSGQNRELLCFAEGAAPAVKKEDDEPKTCCMPFFRFESPSLFQQSACPKRSLWTQSMTLG